MQLFNNPQQNIKEAPVALSGAGSKRHNLSRYGIGLFILINIIGLTTYIYLFGFIFDKKDAIVNSVSKLDIEQLKEERLRAIKNSYRETASKRILLSKYFVDSEGIVTFIEDIERAGKSANVVLKFNFVNIRDTGEQDILAMKFETFGSFREIFYFLKLIEQMPFYTSLEKVLLDKEIPTQFEERKESDTWHGLFTLVVLSFENK